MQNRKFGCCFASASWLVIWFLLLLTPLVTALRNVLVEGDIMLGGLFPIHEAGRNATQCGGIKADQGLQRMAAMLYALKIVNEDPTILPGIRLGAQILDTCSVETHALEQSLEFIKTIMSNSNHLTCADGSRASYQRQPIIAVIGAASSQVSVMVSSMLQLFRIPMLSYSSTGVELSEKPRFDYFSRVVPPDNLQANTMAHLVAQLEWNFVHGVVDSGSYGERGMDSFRAAATERGICLDGDIHKISRRWTDEQFEELLIRMRHSNKARGVVMFVDEDNLRRLLTNLKRMVDSGGHAEMKNYFWFVASDSWGMKTAVIKGFEDIVQGAITVAPQMRHVEGFDEFFGNLGPENTFMSEYWRSMNCSSRINENFQRCFENVGYIFRQEAYVPSVIDSVRIMAKALHHYIDTYCRSIHFKHCHLSRIGFDGYKLQQYYRNKSLEPNGPPLIDENGDGIGKYSIFQLGPGGIYSEVGRWVTGGNFILNVDEIRRGLQEIDNSTEIPVSVCSTPCSRGFYRAYQDLSCCWTCIPCDITTSIIVNETSCIQCPLGQIPNTRFDACRSIRPVHLEWTSPWALLPAGYSLCGIVATMFVVSVFVRYSNTPVVMASGRELCYCMLFGISLCYMVTFVLVSRPTLLVCTLSRLMIGLSLSAIYAAIFVKTNRLARVFKPTTPVRPRCISPPAQVLLCVSIVMVQLIGSLVWLVVDPPDTAIQYPSRVEAVLTCRKTASHLLISLVFNMFLILACTIYAFKTRSIPENFNETRLIGFTMYSTSILWLSFAPIYFATSNNFKIQITSLCICISMSGTVALACFFAPKVYIVLWQPYKNVRTRHSAVGKLVNQQMRFISQMTTPNDVTHPPTRMGLEISTNCTTSASAMDGSTHAVSSSEASCTDQTGVLLGQTPVLPSHSKPSNNLPQSIPQESVVRLRSTSTSTTTRLSTQASQTSATNRRMSLPTNRAVVLANTEGLRSPLMNSEFIKRLCNGGLNLKNRLTFQKGSIEEVSEENIEEDELTDQAETDDEKETEDDPRTCLLRRIDSNQQSPPPIQLLLHEISNDSFATFL
ncbi:Metabotropic glutamate receptor 6 [Aphelenchoides besseyi]|nr:Metabotropic glutamate receptor 6 [Aphelenchoides besseyi]KAI6200389.1 Metabotropic glutamate receptor 6 [Aphelenchoides besseyi]